MSIRHNRLGAVQERQLAAIRSGLAILDDVAPAIQQFQRIRGLTPQTLPRVRCTTQIAFQEYCVFETATDQGRLHVTNKRVLIEGKKRLEIRPLEVIANTDENTITIKTEAKPLRLRVEQPVYAAAMLDLAASIDERPRGFA